jgi:lipopolysaccharide transport system ATP-binding protein
MKPIIKVTGLGKQFHIAHITRGAVRYDTLRESVAKSFRKAFARSPGTKDEKIWALRDASFEVMPGVVVGIIGPNGAGKSTLLKILSRIIAPTTGRAELYGRVASLLEVGTGFHPDLTGRENIYLNGAVLGMKRREIDERFDEIVSFSEIERFLDTSVKHYSSGMYVRLAFAVAAHLNPEILICDEVLAVGDASFQKKCLGKMDDVTRNGRTVLFVSHSMAMIRRLCPRAMLITGGKIQHIGPTNDVVDKYEAMTA